MLFKVKLLSFLMLITLAAHTADDSGNTCSKFFHDFRYKGSPVVEHWSNQHKDEYNYKDESRKGAMLLSHGIFPVPLGYGKFAIIKNGQCVIDRKCPSCGAKYDKLETCAFNNCYYRVKGRKDNGIIVIKTWTRVDDFLHVFNDTKDLAEYKSLTFECLRLSESVPNDDEDDF